MRISKLFLKESSNVKIDKGVFLEGTRGEEVQGSCGGCLLEVKHKTGLPNPPYKAFP